jgi:hypothetical protein
MDQAVSPSDWGAKPVGAESASANPSDWGAKSLSPTPEEPKKGFVAALTEGGLKGYLEETLPVMLYTRFQDLQKASKQFNEGNEWNKEVSRRQAAGEPVDRERMEEWRVNRIEEIIRGGKPESRPASIPDMVQQTIKGAVDDPGGFAGHLVRGLITNPELVFLPEALPLRAGAAALKAGKVASTAARAGTEAAQIGAVAEAESELRQRVETGQISGERTIFETVMAAAPAAAVRALTPRTKAQAAIAAEYAVTKEAKANGVEPSGELVRKAVVETEARVSNGEPLDEAMKGSLEAVKVSPETAAEVSSMLKPEESHAPETRKVEEGDKPEHQRVDAPREPTPEPQADRGDRARPSEEKPKEEARVEPPKPVEVAPAEAKVIRPQQFKPLPEGVPNRFATAEEAKAIYEMAGMDPEIAASIGDKPIAMGALRQRLTKFMGGQKFADNLLVDAVKEGKFGKQSGQVDPRLLAVFGASAAIGLGMGAYTEDPKKAITAALMTGGVVAAGALLLRGARATGKAMRDERYRIGDLTDKYQGDIDWGAFQNQKFKEQIKGMVGDKKQREQITMYLQGDESIKLTPEQKKVAEAVREFFKVNGEKGQKAGALENLVDDYVTQLWTGLNKDKSLWRNLVQSMGRSNTFSSGMSPKSRFGMERVIPSYKEGMAKGLIPTTLDIADIVEIYGNSINKAIANKNFLAALKNEKTPAGQLILGTRDQVIKNLSEFLGKTREQWGGQNALVDDIRRFAERKAANEYETITHRQLPGMMVHKDVAPVLKWFFDASEPNAATKLAYAVSVAAKRGLFSFSFFHNASLAQALLGTSPKGWLKVVNGDAWRALKGKENQGIMQDLIRGGLKITERPLEGDTTPFSNMLKLIYERHPIVGAPAKAVQVTQKVMNAFLWSVVQPTFKTAVAMAALEKTLKDRPQLTRGQAAKAASSFTNDIFGGLDWFRIADGTQSKIGRDLALAVTSPSGRRFMQIMALAPDWTIATARTMAKAIPGISRREIAALHQGYVVQSALLYFSIAEGLNLKFSGHHIWQNEDPTMVDLGDGRKLQLSKHFMEPIHWLVSPAQQAWNKLGYVPKEVAEQLFNKEWMSLKGGKMSGPEMVPGGGLLDRRRVTHAFGGLAPITGQQAFTQGVTPALSGFFGFPIYGKTDEQYVQDAGERAKEAGKDVSKAEDRAKKRRERAKQKAKEARGE